MIRLNASVEAELGNEKVVKSYSSSFDSEVITREELKQFFDRALEEFVDTKDSSE